MKIKLIISAAVAAFTVASSMAFAESAVGNGGFGFVCSQGASTPENWEFELLDVFEGRKLNQFTYQQLYSNPTEKVQRVIDTLLKASLPVWHYNQIKGWYDSFISESKLVPDSQLLQPADTGHLLNRRGCELVTFAVQSQVDSPGFKHYFLNEKYWPHLDKATKEALKLHEILYRFRGSRTMPTSTKIRRINRWLLSDESDSADIETLRQRLAELTK